MTPPNRFEEYTAAAGIGFLLAQALPWWLGLLGLIVAGVSYGLRAYFRVRQEA